MRRVIEKNSATAEGKKTGTLYTTKATHTPQRDPSTHFGNADQSLSNGHAEHQASHQPDWQPSKL
jgi:hypothetical protein